MMDTQGQVLFSYVDKGAYDFITVEELVMLSVVTTKSYLDIPKSR